MKKEPDNCLLLIFFYLFFKCSIDCICVDQLIDPSALQQVKCFLGGIKLSKSSFIFSVPGCRDAAFEVTGDEASPGTVICSH